MVVVSGGDGEVMVVVSGGEVVVILFFDFPPIDV